MPLLEASWMPLQRLRFAQISPQLASWLTDGSSLTQRLIDSCQGDFSVRLMRQGWHRPLYTEARLLRMRSGEGTLVREVELLCNETAMVFARTLIPVSSLKGAAKQLAHLGNRPLGAVLFNSPLTRRSKIEVARITSRHKLYDDAVRALPTPPRELWGRRTIFSYAGSPLLVNEIFLPTISETRENDSV